MTQIPQIASRLGSTGVGRGAADRVAREAEEMSRTCIYLRFISSASRATCAASPRGRSSPSEFPSV